MANLYVNCSGNVVCSDIYVNHAQPTAKLFLVKKALVYCVLELWWALLNLLPPVPLHCSKIVLYFPEEWTRTFTRKGSNLLFSCGRGTKIAILFNFHNRNASFARFLLEFALSFAFSQVDFDGNFAGYMGTIAFGGAEESQTIINCRGMGNTSDISQISISVCSRLLIQQMMDSTSTGSSGVEKRGGSLLLDCSFLDELDIPWNEHSQRSSCGHHILAQSIRKITVILFEAFFPSEVPYCSVPNGEHLNYLYPKGVVFHLSNVDYVNISLSLGGNEVASPSSFIDFTFIGALV